MDALPNELVKGIMDRVDGLTLPILRCVCWSWYDIVGSMCTPYSLSLRRRTSLPKVERKRPKTMPPLQGHACGLEWRDCVVEYTYHVIHAHRWNVFE